MKRLMMRMKRITMRMIRDEYTERGAEEGYGVKRLRMRMKRITMRKKRSVGMMSILKNG